MAFSELLRLVVDADTDGAVRSVNKFGKAADRDLGRAEQKIDKVGAGFRKAGALMLSAGGVAAAGLATTIGAASDLEQSVGAVESVFGDAAGTIEDFGETAAQAAGLSKREVNEMAAVLGAQLQSFGFEADEAADEVVKLQSRAADMAATFGGDTRQALEAIGALMRGERDPIERYGVAIKQSDINARLAAEGLSDLEGEAKKQAEAQAGLALLFEQTAKVEGQFARETDTAAGAQARMRAEIENAKAEIGEALLPIVSKAADALGGLAEAFNGLPKPVRQVAGQVAVWATGLALAGGAVSTLVGQVIKFRDRLGGASRATGTFTGRVGAMGTVLRGAGFLAAAGAVLELSNAFNHATLNIERMARATDAELVTAFQRLRDFDPSLEMEKFEEVAEGNIGTAQRLRDAMARLGHDTAKYDEILDRVIEGERQYQRDAERSAAATGNLSSQVRTATRDLSHLEQQLVNITSRRIGAAVSSIGNVFSFGHGNVFGGARAAGGPVSAGKAYLVGERGPELFVPGQSGGIVANGGGGATINVTVNALDPNGAARAVVDALKAYERTNGPVPVAVAS